MYAVGWTILGSRHSSHEQLEYWLKNAALVVFVIMSDASEVASDAAAAAAALLLAGKETMIRMITRAASMLPENHQKSLFCFLVN